MHPILNCMNFSKNGFSHKDFMYNVHLKMFTMYIYIVFQYYVYLENYAYKVKFDFTF